MFFFPGHVPCVARTPLFFWDLYARTRLRCSACKKKNVCMKTKIGGQRHVYMCMCVCVRVHTCVLMCRVVPVFCLCSVCVQSVFCLCSVCVLSINLCLLCMCVCVCLYVLHTHTHTHTHKQGGYYTYGLYDECTYSNPFSLQRYNELIYCTKP